MTKKDFIITTCSNNITTDLKVIEDKADELLSKWYLTDTSKSKAKNDITISISLPELFNQNILWDNDFLVKLKTDYNMEANFFKNEMNKFLAYRTEKWDNQRKQRWEKEKVFEVKRRFVTWISNNKSKPAWNFWQKKLTII